MYIKHLSGLSNYFFPRNDLKKFVFLFILKTYKHDFNNVFKNQNISEIYSSHKRKDNTKNNHK